MGTYVGITEYTGSERNDTFFTNSQSTKDEKGVSTYQIIISTDGGKKWLAGNYDFVVTNVTPNAYKKVFSQLGCSDSIKVTKSIKEYSIYDYYEKKFKDVTRLTLKVQMGPAVKVGKLYEKHGKYLSSYDSLFPGYYLIPAEDDGDYYYKYDLDLFKRMRGIIEAKLWTDDMTTAEKLGAVSAYINRTTHYPGESISKENNPTLWKDWSVEGKELLYYMADRPLLNGMMKFQGGITTCQASQQLKRVAVEDLGLEYIYDSEKDEILDKEGCWRGIGKYSSAPYNRWHETLWYKDKDLTVYGYDTQGNTYYDEECDCAVHKCREKVIPLN